MKLFIEGIIVAFKTLAIFKPVCLVLLIVIHNLFIEEIAKMEKNIHIG